MTARARGGTFPRMIPSGPDHLILLAAALLVTAIVSSKLSTRFGVPTLVLFLAVGMLAGEDGPGRMAFDDFGLAHAAGTVALILILFDGGLRTPLASLRLAWGPALALATGGVALTAGVTGAVATWVLGLPPLYGFLLGSIVGSTDAAAVFAVLRGQNLALRPRISATLEVESGSNDPMAVLMTLGALGLLTGAMTPGLDLVAFFGRQVVLGVLAGLGIGWVGRRLVNGVELRAAGLYPALTIGVALAAYALPATLGGSGFLAVYLAGVVMGSGPLVFKRGIWMAHDGGAWLAQIVMFVTLGLLATPSRIATVAPEGALIGAVLIFAARPLAVFAMLLPFGFRGRELVFLSWAGLKGAIPIILAVYPLLAGLEHGQLIFDVVFFVVLLSALLQGWSLPFVADRLGVRAEAAPAPPVSLEITSLRHVDGDIVDYLVGRDCFVNGKRIRDLALPESAVVAMVVRGGEVIPPRGSTEIREGDHVFVVLKAQVRALVDHFFAARREGPDRAAPVATFPLALDVTTGALEEFYGIHLDPSPGRALVDLLSERLDAPAVGSTLDAGDYRIAVTAVDEGRISALELRVLALD